MMRAADLRLGFVGDRSVFVDRELWVEAGVGRIVEALRRRCARVTLALSQSPGHMSYHGHQLDIPQQRMC